MVCQDVREDAVSDLAGKNAEEGTVLLGVAWLTEEALVK
jgi:hypothetical protein